MEELYMAGNDGELSFVETDGGILLERGSQGFVTNNGDQGTTNIIYAQQQHVSDQVYIIQQFPQQPNMYRNISSAQVIHGEGPAKTVLSNVQSGIQNNIEYAVRDITMQQAKQPRIVHVVQQQQPVQLAANSQVLHLPVQPQQLLQQAPITISQQSAQTQPLTFIQKSVTNEAGEVRFIRQHLNIATLQQAGQRSGIHLGFTGQTSPMAIQQARPTTRSCTPRSQSTNTLVLQPKLGQTPQQITGLRMGLSSPYQENYLKQLEHKTSIVRPRGRGKQNSAAQQRRNLSQKLNKQQTQQVDFEEQSNPNLSLQQAVALNLSGPRPKETQEINMTSAVVSSVSNVRIINTNTGTISTIPNVQSVDTNSGSMSTVTNLQTHVNNVRVISGNIEVNDDRSYSLSLREETETEETSTIPVTMACASNQKLADHQIIPNPGTPKKISLQQYRVRNAQNQSLVKDDKQIPVTTESLLYLSNAQQKTVDSKIVSNSCIVLNDKKNKRILYCPNSSISAGLNANSPNKIQMIPSSMVQQSPSLVYLANPTEALSCSNSQAVNSGVPKVVAGTITGFASTAKGAKARCTTARGSIVQMKHGYLVVCSHCGIENDCQLLCSNCRHPLNVGSRILTLQATTDASLSLSESLSQVTTTTADAESGPTKVTDSAGTHITKQDFYGKGIVTKAPHADKKIPPNSLLKVKGGRGRGRPKSKAYEEPEILTLSSDDDDDENSKASSQSKKSSSSDQPNSFPTALRLHTPMSDQIISKEPDTCADMDDLLDSVGNCTLVPMKKNSPAFTSVSLKCRSIRIGSYKFISECPVDIREMEHIKIMAPPLGEGEAKSVPIAIPFFAMTRILGHFGNSMPVLFIYIRLSEARRIRKLLKFIDHSRIYFDPSSQDETLKRITILPDKMEEKAKQNLKDLLNLEFVNKLTGSRTRLFIEIPQNEANEILMKSSPPETQYLNSKADHHSLETKTLFIYPSPPTRGGITITTDDYMCLEEEQFLNDVILDFYLKWIIHDKLSVEDRERTHIFSTFFYKRLTSKPKKALRINSPEDDPALTPAQKRHARVKSWTKKVDVFSKDFILIPINEHSHWFLAVICFPGLDGAVSMNDGQPVPAVLEEQNLMQKTKIKTRPKTEIPLIDEVDWSDRDEAEGDDDELEYEEEEEEGKDKEKSLKKDEEESQKTEDEESQKMEEKEPERKDATEEAENRNEGSSKLKSVRPKLAVVSSVKQPCILIFDSLSGACRSKIVATLRDYLAVEYFEKKKVKKVFSRDTMKGACPKVPQQTNFSDCGVFTLQFAESFFEKPIQTYKLPIKSLIDWFPQDLVARKRESIAQLITSLTGKYKPKYDIILPTIRFNSSLGNNEGSRDGSLDKNDDSTTEERRAEGIKDGQYGMPEGDTARSFGTEDGQFRVKETMPKGEAAQADSIVTDKLANSDDNCNKRKLEDDELRSSDYEITGPSAAGPIRKKININLLDHNLVATKTGESNGQIHHGGTNVLHKSANIQQQTKLTCYAAQSGFEIHPVNSQFSLTYLPHKLPDGIQKAPSSVIYDVNSTAEKTESGAAPKVAVGEQSMSNCLGQVVRSKDMRKSPKRYEIRDEDTREVLLIFNNSDSSAGSEDNNTGETSELASIGGVNTLSLSQNSDGAKILPNITSAPVMVVSTPLVYSQNSVAQTPCSSCTSVSSVSTFHQPKQTAKTVSSFSQNVPVANRRRTRKVSPASSITSSSLPSISTLQQQLTRKANPKTSDAAFDELLRSTKAAKKSTSSVMMAVVPQAVTLPTTSSSIAVTADHYRNLVYTEAPSVDKKLLNVFSDLAQTTRAQHNSSSVQTPSLSVSEMQNSPKQTVKMYITTYAMNSPTNSVCVRGSSQLDARTAIPVVSQFTRFVGSQQLKVPGAIPNTTACTQTPSPASDNLQIQGRYILPSNPAFKFQPAGNKPLTANSTSGSNLSSSGVESTATITDVSEAPSVFYSIQQPSVEKLSAVDTALNIQGSVAEYSQTVTASPQIQQHYISSSSLNRSSLQSLVNNPDNSVTAVPATLPSSVAESSQSVAGVSLAQHYSLTSLNNPVYQSFESKSQNVAPLVSPSSTECSQKQQCFAISPSVSQPVYESEKINPLYTTTTIPLSTVGPSQTVTAISPAQYSFPFAPPVVQPVCQSHEHKADAVMASLSTLPSCVASSQTVSKLVEKKMELIAAESSECCQTGSDVLKQKLEYATAVVSSSHPAFVDSSQRITEVSQAQQSYSPKLLSHEVDQPADRNSQTSGLGFSPVGTNSKTNTIPTQEGYSLAPSSTPLIYQTSNIKSDNTTLLSSNVVESSQSVTRISQTQPQQYSIKVPFNHPVSPPTESLAVKAGFRANNRQATAVKKRASKDTFLMDSVNPATVSENINKLTTVSKSQMNASILSNPSSAKSSSKNASSKTQKRILTPSVAHPVYSVTHHTPEHGSAEVATVLSPLTSSPPQTQETVNLTFEKMPDFDTDLPSDTEKSLSTPPKVFATPSISSQTSDSYSSRGRLIKKNRKFQDPIEDYEYPKKKRKDKPTPVRSRCSSLVDKGKYKN